jgi:integrase
VVLGLKSVPSLRKGHTTAPERPPVAPVPDSLVESVLPYLSRTVAAMVRLQRIVGMRSAELCRMRQGDLTTENGLTVFTLTKHKNDHRRRTLTYFLGPQAQAILATFQAKPDEYLFSPVRALAEHQAARAAARKTKPSPANLKQKRKAAPKKAPGLRYTTDSYRVAVQRGLKRYKATLTKEAAATIPNFHPHQLRHNRSTEIRAAFGLEASRAALGHASIEAAAIYAEADFATARRIALETG